MSSKQKKSSTGKKSSNEHELEARRLYVSELYLAGKKQWEIPVYVKKKFGIDISQQTVSNDLAAVREEWKKRSTRLITEAVSEELAKIDSLERMYFDLYERSKGKNGKKPGDLKYAMRIEWCTT